MEYHILRRVGDGEPGGSALLALAPIGIAASAGHRHAVTPGAGEGGAATPASRRHRAQNQLQFDPVRGNQATGQGQLAGLGMEVLDRGIDRVDARLDRDAQVAVGAHQTDRQDQLFPKRGVAVPGHPRGTPVGPEVASEGGGTGAVAPRDQHWILVTLVGALQGGQGPGLGRGQDIAAQTRHRSQTLDSRQGPAQLGCETHVLHLTAPQGLRLLGEDRRQAARIFGEVGPAAGALGDGREALALDLAVREHRHRRDADLGGLELSDQFGRRR